MVIISKFNHDFFLGEVELVTPNFRNPLGYFFK